MTSMMALVAALNWMDPNWWLQQFGQEFFWISVAILFVECGLLFPFLPGDTLLFAMGLFIAGDKIDIVPGNHVIDLIVGLSLMSAGAFLGNIAGYEIGRAIGPPIFERDGRFLRRKHLDQTHAFFEKHGNKALVIGRFVPFVRTYVTVIAGVAAMDRRRFLVWSAVGAVGWVATIVLLGYFLGATFPGLGDNIDIAILVILGASAIPVAWEWVRHRRARTHADSEPTAEPSADHS